MFADIRHVYEMLDQGGGAHGNGGVYFGNRKRSFDFVRWRWRFSCGAQIMSEICD
jgi:hypothetical protein